MPGALDGRRARPARLGQPELGGRGGGARAARVDRGVDGLDDRWVGVAEDERAEGAHVIDIASAIGVPDERPLATHQDRGLASDGPVRAYRAVDAAGGKSGGLRAPGGRVTRAGQPSHRMYSPVLSATTRIALSV